MSRQKPDVAEKNADVTTQPAAGKAAPKKASAESPRGVIAEWTVTIILLLFGTTTLVQAFVIPTGSMEDTLLIGDHLLVDKLAYSPAGAISKYILPFSEVHRGDIIVFRYPHNIRDTFVKRAIGIPGDHIRVVNKQVILNGKTLNEPYTVHKSPYGSYYRDNFPSEPDSSVLSEGLAMLDQNVVNGEVVVPPGNIFAMGDNRDNSLDSRYWGFVPRDNIIGKPLIIYWSYDASTEELSSGTIGVDHIKDLALHFFTKTRWRRTLNLIHGYPLN